MNKTYATISCLFALTVVALSAPERSYAEKHRSFIAPAAAAQIRERMLGGHLSSTLSQGPFALVENYAGDDDEDGFSCSGVLIGPREVLTAAHCVANDDQDPPTSPRQYQVTVGGAKYSVSQTFFNSKYDPNADVDDASSANDLGMLILSKEVTGTSPIPVLSGDPLSVGETGTLYGYGTNQSSSDANETYKSDLADGAYGAIVISKVQNGIFDSLYLTGEADNCEGDSGGPVVRGSGGSKAVLGVVSSGDSDDNRSGACVGEPDDENTFVDLQNPSSIAFLSQFSEVLYTTGNNSSGSTTQLQNNVKQLIPSVRAAASFRSLSEIKTQAKSLAAKLTKSSSLLDASDKADFNDALSSLAKARSAGSLANAQRLLKRALSDLKALIA